MNVSMQPASGIAGARLDPRSTSYDNSIESTGQRSFGDALAAAIDGAASAVDHADRLAATVATGSGNVVDTSIARAKADVLLEIVSVAASRISGALTALLQTQV